MKKVRVYFFRFVIAAVGGVVAIFAVCSWVVAHTLIAKGVFDYLVAEDVDRGIAFGMSCVAWVMSVAASMGVAAVAIFWEEFLALFGSGAGRGGRS